MKKAPTKPISKNAKDHPFSTQDPKPTRARLVSLLDPLGRKRYSEVERYLAKVNNTSSGLFFYENEWGWAVRYLYGAKAELCTLHLLPNVFEATLPLDDASDEGCKNTDLPPELRRKITTTKKQAGIKWVRIPIRSDVDYSNFCKLVQVRIEVLKNRPKKDEEETEVPKPVKKEKATKPKTVSERKPKVAK